MGSIPEVKTSKRTSNVLVSLIMPIYNVENYIEQTIQGLLKQTLQDIEFILVDDGSTDKTNDIVSRYAAMDPRIQVLRKKNGGPASARNHGLAAATGQYICFVDSDDLLPEDALEVLYLAACKYHADLVMGSMVRFSSKGRWPVRIQVEKGLTIPGFKQLSDNPELFYSVGPCAKLYRRDLIQDIRFPEHITLGEDQPFVIQAYLRAHRIYSVGSVVYYYRVREDGNNSLTQEALAKPLSALENLYEMVSLNTSLLVHNRDLLCNYLERVVSMDIWPRLMSALRTRDVHVQAATFESLNNWIRDWDSELLVSVPGVRYWFVKGVIDRLHQVRLGAYRPYWRLLNTIFSKLDSSAKDAFRRRHPKVFRVATKAIRRRSTIPFWWFVQQRKGRQLRTKLTSAFLRRVVFTFGKIFPGRSRKIVLATSKGNQLRGNLKAIYDHIFYTNDVSRLRVYGAHKRGFLQKCCQFYNFGSAATIVLDDYYRPLYNLLARKDTAVVQTWHACGAFKKFGFSAIGQVDSNSDEFERRAHRIYTAAVTDSRSVVPHYAEAFGMPESTVLPIGVPRTDMFFDQELIEYTKRRYLGEYPILRRKKILLYAPTFRGRPGQRAKFNLDLDLRLMQRHLSSEYRLILKLHPVVKKAIRLNEELTDFVLDLSSVQDVNELLLIADLLITDYSSIVFEFSLLRRPIIFYAYDLEEYLSERGFYYDYTKFVPGPIARTTEEVVRLISAGAFDLDRIERFSEHFFDHRDGLSLHRFMQAFTHHEAKWKGKDLRGRAATSPMLGNRG
ncbi:bifunctional glycosyltransferase/CDP-glycerol:glycerophosphate glycerophosphotransferase [Alicyclobacillus shizuokensis]|uniref:bifunctional glycosyltransferase/CDP-glycerol:glycerophosphate glycerophosphotransferase n=1 Tax=Alicyclobacillus shizuokensis TaxID=392014 RepID=UPI0008306A5D|nr:CDP-glycerol:glycerophosphate glycerophosphotransferase [Alicyclobacillus shizuokensis]